MTWQIRSVFLSTRLHTHWWELALEAKELARQDCPETWRGLARVREALPTASGLFQQPSYKNGHETAISHVPGRSAAHLIHFVFKPFNAVNKWILSFLKSELREKYSLKGLLGYVLIIK